MRFKQRRQGEILKRQIFLVKPAVEVACEACDFCGDCFRFFCSHRRSSEYDRADTHSVHVHDLYMYTYAQYYAMREAALHRPVKHGRVRATRCRRTRTVVLIK